MVVFLFFVGFFFVLAYVIWLDFVGQYLHGTYLCIKLQKKMHTIFGNQGKTAIVLCYSTASAAMPLYFIASHNICCET